MAVHPFLVGKNLMGIIKGHQIAVVENQYLVHTLGDLFDVVVNHDATLNGVTLQTSTYEQVKNLTLSNGEKIPELQDFLNILAEDDGPTMLPRSPPKQDRMKSRSQNCP